MNKQATRDRILRAALQVFAEKGYHRAAVDDVVRMSGTSKGAVYHHFPNKEALFLALVDELSARLATALTTAIDSSHGALEKVEAALRAGLQTFAQHRELARLLLLEPVSLGRAYEAKRAEIHGRFTTLIQAYLDQAAAEGSIPSLDTRVASLAWLGAVNEVVIRSLQGDEPGLLARAVPALTLMLLRSIGARASGLKQDGTLSRGSRADRSRAHRAPGLPRRSPPGSRQP